MCLYKLNCLEKSVSLTETVELGVFVPYPDEGREAKDQRRPSVLGKTGNHSQEHSVANSGEKQACFFSVSPNPTLLLMP